MVCQHSMQIPELTKIGVYQETGNMLFGYLLKEAEIFFEKEEKEKEKIKSLSEWKKRKNLLLSLFNKMIGPLPERSPLRPRITGRLKRNGYCVEKVIFESRPKFYVTANLYLPEKFEPPFPAVLVPCGHSQNGKACPDYQKVCIGLVKLGYAVFIYD